MENEKQKSQHRNISHGKKLSLCVQKTLQQLFHTCQTLEDLLVTPQHKIDDQTHADTHSLTDHHRRP